MNKEQLLVLRKQITDVLSTLVLDVDGAPEERVDFLMNIVRLGNADKAVYDKTFETIEKLQDVSQKTTLLFQLLSEVEADIEIVDTVESPVEDSGLEVSSENKQNLDDPQQHNEQHDQ